jgi:aryl-alcohol dehydrogenase-like predicted oxidoreductase
MNRILIQPFGIATTQFGFGCSSLLGLLSERESRALIDAAYDAGIRHFDVARSYGSGSVEGLLGKTLGSRRADVTITTKFGLPVPRNPALVRVARSLARPLVKRLSGMRARSQAVLSSIAATVDFTAGSARQSLEASLKDLRTGYADLFLLHEARAELLTDPRLLDFLRESVQAGKIKGFGCGSDLAVLPELVQARPEYCPVVQHEWSVLTGDVEIPPASFRICHGALLRSFAKLQGTMAAHSDAVGMDLSKPGNLAALLLRSAVLKHPGALTLFSARSVARIQQNVESLGNTQLDPYCARFAAVIERL